MSDAGPFYEVAARRRSVRCFSTRLIEPAKLERIMEVGRMSASADNRQPWRFFLLLGEERFGFCGLLRERFRNAPAIVVACAHPDEAWVRRYDGRNYACIDVAIAVAEMVLAATAEGLGSCWVASFDPSAARQVLGLGGEWEPVTALALGYAAGPRPVTEKKRKARHEAWEIRGQFGKTEGFASGQEGI